MATLLNTIKVVMTIEIQEVTNKKELNQFINFQYDHYKDHPHWVPPLVMDERNTLNKKKNPAFDTCKAKYWLALKEGTVVGRIAGIIHNQELEEKKLVRFGWIEFQDDEQISALLIKAVRDWGKTHGATGIHGPLGFTDMDFEGMLIEGFEESGTLPTIYNYAYYPRHMEALGFHKDVDWIQGEGKVPSEIPHRLKRKVEIIQGRFGYQIVDFKKSDLKKKWGNQAFDVLNRAYKDLYGFYPLTDKQIKYYVEAYLGFVRKEYVSIITNTEGQLIGFGVAMPSFTKALQKNRGKLLPFGFISMLKALKADEELDLYLIAVDVPYQKTGVDAMIFYDIFKEVIKNGVKTIKVSHMLEENKGVLNLWNDYEHVINKRRRCYHKEI